MANTYINIWQEGTTPGVFNSCVSSDGSGSNPVAIGPLNVASGDSAAKRLLIKTEPNYKTIAGQNTVIQPVGASAAKWQLAPDNNGTPGTYFSVGAALTITSQITNGGVYFWAKAVAAQGEAVQNDATVDLKVTYGVQAG
jgi:hypothetical protein